MINEKALLGEQSADAYLKRREIIETIKKKTEITGNYLQFGRDYFDNPEIVEGYSEYKYDGRYGKNVEHIINTFELSRGSRVLEIGCAKGYILKEFKDRGMSVFGVDISEYAVENCHPDVKGKISVSTAESLNFEDQSIDFLICKDVLPHIPLTKINNVFSEIKRVCKDNIFLEIQCGRTKLELEDMKLWDPTHQIIETPVWWQEMLEKHRINATVYFKILIPEEINEIQK